MTSSEEFKQAIRTGNINEAFLVAMSNAPELSITTKIITSSSGQNSENSTGEQQDHHLSTHINLIEGKIENEIGEKLTGDRYSEIKQFHMGQVAEGYQTIQHNLITLQKMFQLMSTFQQQQTTEHLNWLDIAADVSRESLPPQPPTTQLYSQPPEALAAGKVATLGKTNIPQTAIEERNEPELPSFEEDEEDHVVDDLLSLADLDDDSTVIEHPPGESESGDWGEWLEDEPEVKPQVFNLKSLNMRQGQNWQHWDAASSNSIEPDSTPKH